MKAAAPALGPGADSCAQIVPSTGGRGCAIALQLLLLAALRLAIQVGLTPVFEGPDEAFHLGRATAFARGGLAVGWREETLDSSIVRAIRAHPCAPDLQRAFGCRGFPGSSPDLAGQSRGSSGSMDPVWNYESHQPPLYYLGVAGAIALFERAAPAGNVEAPERDLVIGRFFSLALVVTGGTIVLLGIPGARRATSLAFAGLILLLPGASEALIRVSNDAGLFFWSACACVWLCRDRPSRSWGAVIAAVGPLIKLTAFPIVAVMVVQRWAKRDRLGAVMVALASCLVLPLQSLRGYAYGGTVELNRSSGQEILGLGETVLGLAKSFLVCLKTAVWLGNWSFFRPPRVLLIALVVVFAWVLLAYRPTSPSRENIPHLAGLIVAAVGIVAFSVGSRRLFGIWGGVGGWYLWGWTPWLFVAAQELLEKLPNARAWPRITVLGAAVLATNIAWLQSAVALYGCLLCGR
ncbi:MAG: DUF2142 domain-containing protein [Thermoanaerobaculia bacterium]